MVAGEVFLVVLITVLSIKYKKYYAAVLSIAQTALEFWYEFSGVKPKNQISNFYCDQLTIIMILIIAVVGTFITIYACGYMDDYHQHHGNEVKDRRCFFFAIMYVFIGAMFGLVLCICFNSATTLFCWSKWLATVLSSNPSDRRHKNTISINQWASLFTHSGLMILIVFVFPLISKYVVKPYTAKVFHNDYAVISYENIVLTTQTQDSSGSKCLTTHGLSPQFWALSISL